MMMSCSLASEMRLEVQLWQLGRTSQEIMGAKLNTLLQASCSDAEGPQVCADP